MTRYQERIADLADHITALHGLVGSLQARCRELEDKVGTLEGIIHGELEGGELPPWDLGPIPTFPDRARLQLHVEPVEDPDAPVIRVESIPEPYPLPRSSRGLYFWDGFMAVLTLALIALALWLFGPGTGAP